MTSAFGMQMPGRTFSGNGIGGSDYKYSFNGKEDDKSSGWYTQDYGFRNYDYRLGRFFSQDPLFRQYPELTPYQFASNTPIQAIDRDGLEAESSTGGSGGGGNGGTTGGNGGATGTGHTTYSQYTNNLFTSSRFFERSSGTVNTGTSIFQNPILLPSIDIIGTRTNKSFMDKGADYFNRLGAAITTTIKALRLGKVFIWGTGSGGEGLKHQVDVTKLARKLVEGTIFLDFGEVLDYLGSLKQEKLGGDGVESRKKIHDESTEELVGKPETTKPTEKTKPALQNDSVIIETVIHFQHGGTDTIYIKAKDEKEAWDDRGRIVPKPQKEKLSNNP